jgi:hypothetical protein
MVNETYWVWYEVNWVAVALIAAAVTVAALAGVIAWRSRKRRRD